MTEEAMVLCVGVEWAEAFHDVALGRPGEGVIEQFRIEHGPGGVARLTARCLELEPDPAEVRVVLETRHGLAEDARICCLMALEAYLGLRPLIPHGEAGSELRAIARDDERAARDERRIGNRLRADLLAVFSAPLDVAAGDPGAAVFLRLLERWPSAGAPGAGPPRGDEGIARAWRPAWARPG